MNSVPRCRSLLPANGRRYSHLPLLALSLFPAISTPPLLLVSARHRFTLTVNPLPPPNTLHSSLSLRYLPYSSPPASPSRLKPPRPCPAGLWFLDADFDAPPLSPPYLARRKFPLALHRRLRRSLRSLRHPRPHPRPFHTDNGNPHPLRHQRGDVGYACDESGRLYKGAPSLASFWKIC